MFFGGSGTFSIFNSNKIALRNTIVTRDIYWLWKVCDLWSVLWIGAHKSTMFFMRNVSLIMNFLNPFSFSSEVFWVHAVKSKFSLLSFHNGLIIILYANLPIFTYKGLFTIRSAWCQRLPAHFLYDNQPYGWNSSLMSWLKNDHCE